MRQSNFGLQPQDPPYARKLEKNKKALAALAACALFFIPIFPITHVNAATVYNVPPTIKDDCSIDVTADLESWFASVPDNSTLVFGQNKCYDIDEGLVVADRNGLTFDGNGSTFKFFTIGTSNRSNWTVQSGSNITLENMIARGANPSAGINTNAYVHTVEWQHAYSFQGTQTATLDNVQAYDVYGDFIEAQPDKTVTPFPGLPVHNLIVKNSHFERNGRMGVGLTHVDGLILENNYFGDVNMAVVDIELDYAGESSKNIQITGNTFGKMRFSALSISGAGQSNDVTNITFSNNTMTVPAITCQPGVLVTPKAGVYWSDFTIENNKMQSLESSFMFTRAKNLTIDGNSMVWIGGGCGQKAGIAFFDSHQASVTENTLSKLNSIVYADSLSDNIVASNNNATDYASLTTPLNGATISGVIPVDLVFITAGAAPAETFAQINLDGKYLTSVKSSPGPYNFTWDTTKVTDGPHTLAGIYGSVAGNYRSIDITVNVLNNPVSPNPSDTTPPTIVLTQPAANATISGSDVVISADVSDNIGVAGVQFKLDGVNIGSEISTAPYQLALDTTHLVNGNHTLTGVARDNSDNVSSTAALSVVVNNSASSVNPPPSSGGGVGIVLPPPVLNPTAGDTNENNPTTPPLTTPPQPTFSPSQIRLINDHGTYYLIQGGQRLGVTNPGMLWSQGLDFKDAVAATPDDEALPQGPNLTPRNGSLVKTAEDKTVYFISSNQKHGFTSEQVFLGQGFKWSAILTVTQPELDELALGSIINDPNAVHLPGTDIQIGQTIYWIGPEGSLHPYPSLAIYNSWHRQNDFSTVVPGNQGDRGLSNSDTVIGRVLK